MRDLARLVITLTVVCVGAAFALSLANEVTKEARAKQDRLARLEAIDAVLPDYDNRPDEETVEIKTETERVISYIGRKDGQIVGFAFEQEGEGYSGKIRVMIGLNPAGEILGIDVVKHAETPGLGAIIDEPQEDNPFKDQFFKEKREEIGKSALTSKSKIAVIKDGGQIEAITGATISPRGVCEAIRKGLELFEEAKDSILKDAD